MEIPKFLIEMSQQMNGENNRSTADPVWQVRCKRMRATSSDHTDIFEIRDNDGDYTLVATNQFGEDINEQIIDHLDVDLDDLPVIIEEWVDAQDQDLNSGQDKVDYFIENFDFTEDDLTGFDMVWVEEYEEIIKGAFLTEQDARWFINRKQHDYPNLYTYVESMNHCPQTKELRAWIKSLAPKIETNQ